MTQATSRHRGRRRLTILIYAALLGTGLVFAALLLATGSMKFGFIEIARALVGFGENHRLLRVVVDIRLPRVLTAALVGASLGVAGAIFQSVARNPLGSPDILGFSTGAATGAILQIIVLGAGATQIVLSAVAAGLITAFFVYGASRRRGSAEGPRLVLVGIGAGAILSGFNTLLLVAGDLDRAMAAQVWLSGSLMARSWAHVGMAAISLALALPLVLIFLRPLRLIEMGDDLARQLGVKVEATRLTMMLAGVVLTASATAAAGPIAFLALIAPHLARRILGVSQFHIVPAGLFGATLLLGADLACQTAARTINVPIGLGTGMIGGIYLLFFIRSRQL